jgi:pSer/pThr/pTyr-binding forkhead associated (FHA) protein
MASGSNGVAIALTIPGVNTYLLAGQSDYLVGRPGTNNTQPDVDLSEEYGADSSVSRRHVMIHVRADGVFVEDLESTNETIHNGYRLRPQQWYPLLDGDELRLGAVVLNVSIRRR